MTPTPEQKEAVEYFYPKGYWGGYSKFFSPHAPSRIGDTLITCIRRAIQGDRTMAEEAIFILSTKHLKNVHATKGPPTGTVWCIPTDEAQTAISKLLFFCK